jgi:hypothetical protein
MRPRKLKTVEGGKFRRASSLTRKKTNYIRPIICQIIKLMEFLYSIISRVARRTAPHVRQNVAESQPRNFRIPSTPGRIRLRNIISFPAKLTISTVLSFPPISARKKKINKNISAWCQLDIHRHLSSGHQNTLTSPLYSPNHHHTTTNHSITQPNTHLIERNKN